ncbi:hypothetical protein PROPEN_00172 [Proteus penneri ATCC 35198]|nr:hypothetical protein PROPEN_00172 [Proteus penneri ATCC 35198]
MIGITIFMKRQLLASLGLALGLICHNTFAAELHLYAGAGLKQPVEQVVSVFEKKRQEIKSLLNMVVQAKY